jgi:hypothetical protein
LATFAVLIRVVHKLRCGIIYTNAFADYLGQLYGQSQALAQSRIALLEYVQSAQTGEQYWNIQWRHESKVPEGERFTIGSIPVGMSKSTLRGLKHRCLDYQDGTVRVR